MHADPFNLDGTEYSKVLKQNYERTSDLESEKDFLEEPEHPLRSDRAIAGLCDHLDDQRQQLGKARGVSEISADDDPYFEFEGGAVLRPEVVVKIAVDYLRAHPELLTQ